MKRVKYWFLIISLLAFAAGIRAQQPDSVRWSGNVQLKGAANFNHASNASLSLGLKREAPKLSVSLDLSGNSTRTLRTREVSYSSESITYGHKEYSRSEGNGWGENLRMGLRYTPRTTDVFQVSFSQSCTFSDRNDTLHSQKIGAVSGQAVLLAEGSSRESAERRQNQFQLDASYLHRLDADRRSVHAELFFKDRLSKQTNVRMLDGSLYTPVTYRITPTYGTRNSRLNLLYRDAKFLEVASLDFSAGMDLQWSMSNDCYGGATLVDSEWRDSLLLKQKYLYRSATAEPYATLGYRYRMFDFFAEERFQYYNHKLWSNLNGWDWNKSDLFHSSRLSARCTPSGGHRLQLELERSLSRPDYLMLSGLLRFGSSPDVYYLGNADLQPTRIYRMDLQYQLSVRKWEFGIQTGCRLMNNVTEQVLFTDREKLPASLREKTDNAVVYSWLNTAVRKNYHLKLNACWKSGAYELNAWSVLNYDVYSYASSTSTDFNGTIGFGGSRQFHEHWKIVLNNTFDSRRKEVYTHTSAYLRSNLRVEYAQGRWRCHAGVDELFDRPVRRTVFSENFDYWRTESTRHYRRLLVLGVSCRF